ncbi:MAG: 30S ribosome-binding factor RbfA [Blautia sp.]|nr:30S ribosome-binding factor RbfA [Blautia sp.]
MRKNSIKNTRINGEVQKELSRIIRSEVKDPRIHPMTSVLRAVVAPDLKSCKAYISVLGNEEAVKETLAGLRAAEGYIRRELAHGLNLRNTPEITFLADGSIAYGVSMSHRIDEVIQADLRSAELRGEESEEQAEEEISLNSISRGEDEDA